MQNYYHTSAFNLFIAPSGIKRAGLGVYTHDTIGEGSFIDYYQRDIEDDLNSGESLFGKYFFAIDNHKGIDASSFPRCMMAMINDGKKDKNNNCEFRVEKDDVKIYSIKDIHPGEELFVSYGDEYWKK